MPLYKRTHFQLVKQPEDLDPHELVYQVRFTKEIFRDYQEYLNRLNLFRQRVWTCKATGKTSLTYEEALVSECRANEKVQQIPKELVAPILHMVQYSTLKLKHLVNSISTKLQERLFKGAELFARKGQSICACRILEILEDEEKIRYEVGWFDKNKEITSTSVVDSVDLMRKKLPFSRSTLKSFIRESTSRSAPWVIHEKLAKKFGISTEPPEDLRSKLSVHKGSCKTKDDHRVGDKKNILDAGDKTTIKKRKRAENETSDGFLLVEKKAKEDAKPKEQPIRYPIEDLLVKPGEDDPLFTERPTPCREFSVPMDCVGDLLMVWDFCSSFSRLLRLWPFSLEDFEKAICHKDSDLILIIESHSAILQLIMKHEGEFFEAVQKKKRKSKITQANWTVFLCDFMEMLNKSELSSHVAIIKRGHYGLLDPQAKLGIFRELVTESLATDAVREQLDEYIEQQRELAATKREELKKKREEQHPKPEESGAIISQGSVLQNGKGNLPPSEVERNYRQNQNVSHEGNGKVPQANGHHISENGTKEHKVANTMKTLKRAKSDGKGGGDEVKNSSGTVGGKKAKRSRKEKEREAEGKNMEERRIGEIEREIEKRFIRTTSLGKDRNYNRYWFFRRDGRLFVEGADFKQWGYYTSKEELDAFMGSLNPKGERERALKGQLGKYYPRISSALQKRSKDIAQKILLEESVLRRSTRVRAQPRDNLAMAFLRYTNRWKE